MSVGLSDDLSGTFLVLPILRALDWVIGSYVDIEREKPWPSYPYPSMHDPTNEKQKRVIAQRGARTHDPEIKSLMLYRLS